VIALSEHFCAEEMACRCGCGLGLHPDDLHPELLDLLEQVRALAGGLPLAITSGLRCPAHNAAQGGVPDSPHCRGAAADIACGSAVRRWQLLVAAVTAGAQGIGLARTFVHVDVDRGADRHRPAAWGYGSSE
jgi:zinc D-Ala-D-Ala carboxypeptidase